MMHYEQYVVTIADQTGKTFREFDSERLQNGRKSKIYIPYNSEYKIGIKNNSDRRLKMTIDLDGTSISGLGGLIMSAYTSEFLERFVDVARKFKFVRKNDERVSDPSNVENGLLKISIEKEVQPYSITSITTTQWPPNGTWVCKSSPPITQPYDVWGQPMYGSGSAPCGYSHQAGDVIGASTNDAAPSPSVTAYNCKVDNHFNFSEPETVKRCLRSASVSPKKPIKALLNEESGATVEGASSSQVFTQTTWNGTDGLAYEFIFKLLGQDGVSDTERVEYAKYLELKKKFER